MAKLDQWNKYHFKFWLYDEGWQLQSLTKCRHDNQT